jgi:beta-1,4-mannosyltransferase
MNAAGVRVVNFPHLVDEHPYYRLVYGALAAHGVRQIRGAEYKVRWFQENCAAGDWVHFHWVHYSYASNSRRLMTEEACRFIGFLLTLKRMRLRLAWTVHNLLPHDSPCVSIDYAVRLALARVAELVIVHSAYTKRQVRRAFFRSRDVIQIPCGHFADYYPNTATQQEARAQLGIPPQAFVYLSLGMLRPYKGVEELIGGFRRVNEPNSILLVAGDVVDVAYGQHLHELAGKDERVRLHIGYIPDVRLQEYFNASDLAVLPFRRVTTSASLLLALSFGIPVLVADRASLREYVSPRIGCVMRPREEMHEALRRARSLVLGGHLERGAPVIAWVRQFSWEAGAAAVAPFLSRPQ